MLAAIKYCGELISTARDTSKRDRLTFQDWVALHVEKEDLTLEDLIQVYGEVGGPQIPTHYPYDPLSWPEEQRYRGKILVYGFNHRYILLSAPYEHDSKIKWRLDTHFHHGRLYLYDGMPKKELLDLIDAWAYRSRSKDFCWAIVFLLGAFFCTQATQR
jgi:hypothetical protein